MLIWVGIVEEFLWKYKYDCDLGRYSLYMKLYDMMIYFIYKIRMYIYNVYIYKFKVLIVMNFGIFKKCYVLSWNVIVNIFVLKCGRNCFICEIYFGY